MLDADTTFYRPVSKRGTRDVSVLPVVVSPLYTAIESAGTCFMGDFGPMSAARPSTTIRIESPGAPTTGSAGTRSNVARITLDVNSALDGVGLTAAVAQALAARGIAANVVAGFHHDHVFVPAAQGEAALAALEARAAQEHL